MKNFKQITNYIKINRLVAISQVILQTMLQSFSKTSKQYQQLKDSMEERLL